MKVKPAVYVIAKFGGVTKLARAIGRNKSSVSKWRKPKSKNGCGGFIPCDAQQCIWRVAKRRKIKISAANLIVGGHISRSMYKDGFTVGRNKSAD